MKIDCAIKSRRIQAVKLANALNTIEGVPVSDYAKELSQQITLAESRLSSYNGFE